MFYTKSLFILLCSLYLNNAFGYSYDIQKLPEDFAFNNSSEIELSGLTGLMIGTNTQDIDKNVLKPFSSDGCSSSPDGIPLSENSEA
jgi:hypothetical protein